MSSLLVPYKYSSLDLVAAQPTLMSNSQNYFLTVVSKYWYRVFKLPQLKILLDSVVFEGKVRAIAQGSNDEHVFVAVRRRIYVMKHHECIHQIDLPATTGKIGTMLVLHPYILASIDQTLHLIYEDQFDKVKFASQILGIIHPPTYLNKIVTWTAKHLTILNIVTKQIIVQLHIEELFSKLSQDYDDHDFVTIEPSPALDVVAISLGHPSGSLVLLINLLTFATLQVYETGQPVTQIGFNSQGKIPIMALVHTNSLKLIELNKQVLIYTHTHEHSIDWIRFVTSHPSIYVGSASENSIRELSYDFEQPQLLTCIRERCGFEGHINTLSFIGHEDDPYGSLSLLGSSDLGVAEVRWLSLVNENMNARFSQKSNKAMQKGHRMTEEQIGNTMPTVTKMSFSVNRANDWSNVLTLHKNHNKPALWNSENRSVNKIKVDMHQSMQEKAKNSALVSVFVTSCGNFGFIGLDDGRLVKMTMQSGSHVRTINLPTPARHIFVDSLNQFVILAQDNLKLLQLDFYSGKVFKEADIESNVTLLSSSKTSVLVLTAHVGRELLVWDFTQLKVIRRLIGHQQAIVAAQFSYDNQFVVSSSEGTELFIWGVLRGELIQQITLLKPIVALDISPNNNLLCAVFQGSRSISVFKSHYDVSRAAPKVELRFASDIVVKPSDSRSLVYGAFSKHEDDPIEVEIEAPSVGHSLITFTVLDDGKWVPLQHIEQIRSRNRVKLAEEDVKIPFFMDFRSIDQEKQKLLEELKGKANEQSKIIKHGKDKLIAELGSDFQRLLDKQAHTELFEYLKTLSPSHLDYDMRSSFLGHPQHIAKMITFFDNLFDTPGDLDLKVTYLNHFLKVSGGDLGLIYDNTIRGQFLSIQNKLKISWGKLEDLKDFVDGVTEYLKQRK